MKSRLLLATAAFAAVTAFAPLAAHATDMATDATTTTTTESTVTTNDNTDTSAIPADEDATSSATADGDVTVEPETDTGAAAATDAGAGTDADSKTVKTTTTVTDTTVTPPPAAPKPVVAPSVKGHKKGDHKDAAKHAATGSDESSTAGDKAAKAITPLKDSSVPADGKADIDVDVHTDTTTGQ
jgi:hypothetical protein